MSKYRYNEDVYLQNIMKYLSGTYGEHYVAKDIQVIDIWESLDSLESTARDTAIKYLCRYGKKDGKNRKDLLKAIHYIILMMYASDRQDQQEKLGESEYQSMQTTQPEIQDAYDKVNNYDAYLRTQQ